MTNTEYTQLIRKYVEGSDAEGSFETKKFLSQERVSHKMRGVVLIKDSPRAGLFKCSAYDDGGG